jgi:hypothetical protein
MLCSLASLDKEKVNAIQSLEKKIGKTLLAFSCREMKIEALKDEEIAQIREAEQRLGLSLVAVK